VAIDIDLPAFWHKLNLQTGVCKSFYASYHLHCYREPPKADPADSGELPGLIFFCLVVFSDGQVYFTAGNSTTYPVGVK